MEESFWMVRVRGSLKNEVDQGRFGKKISKVGRAIIG